MYGSIIYQLLGDKAQEQFSHDWAVGLGLDQANQWQSVVKSAVQAAIILTIIHRLDLVSPQQWLEVHLDQFSVQAAMFHCSAKGFFARLGHVMQHMARIEAK